MAALPALADQRYLVNGDDRYALGVGDLQTNITYSGSQILNIRQDGSLTRFTAEAHYTRADSSGRVPAQATFEQVMTPKGELQDRADLDPDYLTVLNQPFAIELDGQTLYDLQHLKGELPFSFPAPMTNGTLQGFIERGPVGRVASRPALAVRFDASGPMRGPLPGHAGLFLSGTMRMRGTAYYAVRGEALLLALDETLTISGKLRDRSGNSPVTIVYHRAIKADDAGPSQTEADTRRPPVAQKS